MTKDEQTIVINAVREYIDNCRTHNYVAVSNLFNDLINDLGAADKELDEMIDKVYEEVKP